MIFETPRLCLRRVTKEDIKELFSQIFSNKEVVKYTFGHNLFSFDEAKTFIENNCNFNGIFGLSVIEEKRSSKVIGLAGIVRCNYLDCEDYEIGFILGKTFWGKGYATEIGEGQIEFAKDKLKANRVLALAHKDNVGSLNCIKKLGFKYCKTISTSDGRGDREVFYINL